MPLVGGLITETPPLNNLVILNSKQDHLTLIGLASCTPLGIYSNTTVTLIQQSIKYNSHV